MRQGFGAFAFALAFAFGAAAFVSPEGAATATPGESHDDCGSPDFFVGETIIVASSMSSNFARSFATSFSCFEVMVMAVRCQPVSTSAEAMRNFRLGPVLRNAVHKQLQATATATDVSTVLFAIA